MSPWIVDCRLTFLLLYVIQRVVKEYGLHIAPFLFEVLKSGINTKIKMFVVQETEFDCGLDCVILLDRICYRFNITPVTSCL